MGWREGNDEGVPIRIGEKKSPSEARHIEQSALATDKPQISSEIMQAIQEAAEKASTDQQKFTLTNRQARNWYNANIKMQIDGLMSKMTERGASLEERARAAHALRNEFRNKARDLMKDRQTAESLDPNWTWDEIYEKYQGDYNKIIEGSKRTNESINRTIEEDDE